LKVFFDYDTFPFGFIAPPRKSCVEKSDPAQ
jgi:hypothetical protein